MSLAPGALTLAGGPPPGLGSTVGESPVGKEPVAQGNDICHGTGLSNMRKQMAL
jgi:hypothetical protein